MAEDIILKLFRKPEDLNLEKVEPKDIQRLASFLSGAEAAIGAYHAIAQSIGELALSWAALDAAVDDLFEPLLECSGAQVACILVENIGARCEMLKKLLHVEPLPPKWTAWVEALLNRTSGELASLRNRYIHDAWRISAERAVRSDKRVKLGKPQSRQKKKLSFKTEHVTTAEDINRLAEQVVTVATALRVAVKNLRTWRAEGRRPRTLKQWLPASKPHARMLNYQADPSTLERPLFPLKYSFN